MYQSCYIELSRKAFQNNLDYLRDRFGPDTLFSSVIKGNAYGHGINHILPMAESFGVRHFSVFSADEALAAFNARTKESEIMIMGMIDNSELEWAIENEISFYVFEQDRLKTAIDIAIKHKKRARIHLELETGMFRTGFGRDELEEVIAFLKENSEHVIVEGICTHYAGAESVSNYLRVKNQMKEYAWKLRRIRQSKLEFRFCHTACSAAALRYPRTIMNMVRIGIAQYGFWPTRETYMHDLSEQMGDGFNGDSDAKIHDPLKRVISWKSKVMSTKSVPPNRFIGYGTAFLTNQQTKIATVPIGYSHGFTRDLSNLGRVLINGQRASVIGVVNMNMMIVDVTSIEGVEKGSPVTIIGNDGDTELTVGSFSELTNRLNYETLTRLPRDIPRFIKE